jgi:hypothetical protein
MKRVIKKAVDNSFIAGNFKSFNLSEKKNQDHFLIEVSQRVRLKKKKMTVFLNMVLSNCYYFEYNYF